MVDINIAFFKVLFSFMLIWVFFILLLKSYNALVVKPWKLRSALKKQGIDGPPPTFLLGNLLEINRAFSHTANGSTKDRLPLLHNVQALLFPFFDKWRQQYGEELMYSIGNTYILHVTRPNMVKEIINYTTPDFGKPPYHMESIKPLFGSGVVTSSGLAWSSQRKILAPEFHLEKLKGMIKLIQESTHMLLDQWKAEVEAHGGIADIDIDPYMRRFSGEVISRACFGSSYIEGEEIFSKLRAILLVVSKSILVNSIPGMRHVPTKSNRKIWSLQNEIRNSILKIVTERKKAGIEDDLLQTILEAAKTRGLSQDSMNKFIVDNCKSFYLAGYETTAVSAQWCLMLLSLHPEWQNRVRAEVLEICQGEVPDIDMIHKMKQLTMVINETLRLYPPIALMPREAFTDLRFGNITIPKDFNIWLIVTTLHTDPKVWGSDAYEFKPNRFENGIAGACKHPYMYMPFGAGVRVCLGQNLALLELKILISLLLSKFTLSLSPKYIHDPTFNLVIEPRHGVHLLVKKTPDIS